MEISYRNLKKFLVIAGISAGIVLCQPSCYYNEKFNLTMNNKADYSGKQITKVSEQSKNIESII